MIVSGIVDEAPKFPEFTGKCRSEGNLSTMVAIMGLILQSPSLRGRCWDHRALGCVPLPLYDLTDPRPWFPRRAIDWGGSASGHHCSFAFQGGHSGWSRGVLCSASKPPESAPWGQGLSILSHVCSA
jgi:hypothetical protein